MDESWRVKQLAIAGHHLRRGHSWEGARLPENRSESDGREVLPVLDTTVDDGSHASGHERRELCKHTAVRVHNQRYRSNVEPSRSLFPLEEAFSRAEADQLGGQCEPGQGIGCTAEPGPDSVVYSTHVPEYEAVEVMVDGWSQVRLSRIDTDGHLKNVLIDRYRLYVAVLVSVAEHVRDGFVPWA